MDKLTKGQKDEFATSFAILALYDGGVSNTGTVGCDETRAQRPLAIYSKTDMRDTVDMEDLRRGGWSTRRGNILRSNSL